jgi:hypothetical protein
LEKYIKNLEKKNEITEKLTIAKAELQQLSEKTQQIARIFISQSRLLYKLFQSQNNQKLETVKIPM